MTGKPPAGADHDAQPGWTADREAERIRRIYASYDHDPRVQARRDPHNAANQLIEQERIAALSRHLANVPIRLADADILDIGCGAGGELLRLVTAGANPRRCHGVDVLHDRVRTARERLPAVDVRLADARELPYPATCMDLVVLKVVISSVLDPEICARISGEVDRVLRPGGAVLWYDNRYYNPFNSQVRGIPRRELASLFPGYDQRLSAVTVIPPLVRRFGRLTAPIYRGLASMRLSRVRYAGVLVKGRG